MENNNLSRKEFSEFIKKNKFERLDNRNIFVKQGKNYFYLKDVGQDNCRQFYDDCDGIYLSSGSYLDRNSLQIGSVTRISPNGAVARSAKFIR